MAVDRPQHDLPSDLLGRLSGASDLWDEGLGGALLTADFFAIPSGGPTTYFLSVGGSVTAVSGVRKFSSQRDLIGSITMTSAVSSRFVVRRAYASSITPSGAIRRGIRKRLLGSATASGVLRRATRKALSGAITAAGNIRRRIVKRLLGLLLAAAVISERTTTRRTYGSSITASGSLLGAPPPPPSPTPAGASPRARSLYKYLR